MNCKRCDEDELWVKVFEIIAHKDEEIARLKKENSRQAIEIDTLTNKQSNDPNAFCGVPCDFADELADTINQQKAEIERLKAYIEKYGKKWWEMSYEI